MPFLQLHHARVTRNGFTVIITRCPAGSTMSLTVVRPINGRLLRPPRVYTGTPKHNRNTAAATVSSSSGLASESYITHTHTIYPRERHEEIHVRIRQHQAHPLVQSRTAGWVSDLLEFI